MSEIPARFSQATFDGFQPATKSQHQALAAVESWLQLLNDGPMLALVGKQGTGKSHLLYSAARQLNDYHASIDIKERQRLKLQWPFVAAWYRLSDELRWGMTGKTSEGVSRNFSSREIRESWWGRKVVLLDEVRPTSGTGFDDTELAKFACHAYDNRIAVLITTNWNPLSDVMGKPAASRFTQIVIDGPDARQVA